MTFQRIVQALSLILFLGLLWSASFPLDPRLPVDAFLRLDPLVLPGTSISARAAMAGLWIPIVLLLSGLFLGRYFCGTICPMGITLDMADHLIARGRRRASSSRKPPQVISASLRHFKTLLLLFIFGAALMGISLVFIASPLSLITRFYALAVSPVLNLLGEAGLAWLRPLADALDMRALYFAEISVSRFSTQWFIVAFFIGVFACALWSPRFWCRYLCPSGALLALFSHTPIVRRRVSQECTQCGLCAKKCPMGAISDDGFSTFHEECIVCETCVRVCPQNAVTFSAHRIGSHRTAPTFLPERRRFLLAGLAGAGTAAITLTGLDHPQAEGALGRIVQPTLIRPPGALPETDFLRRCIRCGECMKVCPTNALQPIWFMSGFSGLFSPKITPRRGPCEPLCNACGHVCPTGAVRPLDPEEKIWAKVGTAIVLRHKCLAWELGKKCLVCDEVCRFNALELRKVSDSPVAVPFVNETKCSGCGFCEYHCPVQGQPAIVVEAMGALRLRQGSYTRKAQDLGYSFRIRQAGESGYESPEALQDPQSSELPPGFTE